MALRAAAIQNGLDPDKAMPEDILAMAKDDKGNLIIMEYLDQAQRTIQYMEQVREINEQRNQQANN